MSFAKTMWLAPCAVVFSVYGGYVLHAYAEGAPTSKPLFYSGTLETGGKLATGPYAIALTLYNREAGGDKVCTSETPGVMVATGRFRIEVSADCVAAVKGNRDAWAALKFTGADGVPHELPGRTKIGAVPYALEADHAVAATNGVPKGAILMFSGACPSGYAEFTALRGRVPRGEPTGAATALDAAGSDDAVVVSHTHTGSAGGGDHAHSGTTGGQSADHSHAGATDGNVAWPTCDIYDGSGGAGNSFNPAVFTTGYIGGNCSYRDKTLHAHSFSTGGASANHTHDFSTAGGAHSHSFTTASPPGAVSAAGKNMQAFREVLFCVKQ